MKLTAPERERGWVIHSCPADGDLVACSINATVVCRCRKRAVATRDGQPVTRQERARIKASAKSLQNKG
jgi:hypothetical protein